MALYGLLAWPPAPLARWLTAQQRQLGLAAYGPPHLNLRTPFEWEGQEAELRACVARALRGVGAFEVSLHGWRRFPHTIFLELALDSSLRQAHQYSLALDGVPAGPRDGQEYIPHLTLALGILPWAEEGAWQKVQALAAPPLTRWTVRELALTLERQGTLQEVARFRLEG